MANYLHIFAQLNLERNCSIEKNILIIYMYIRHIIMRASIKYKI